MLTGLLVIPLLPLVVDADTTELSQQLDEVVVSAATGGQKRSGKGQLASIDEHLVELEHVNLVRRGSYAWEPVVNNMQMERVSTTIDGMKIFYACTDKMDPVTSYVESGNLQSISLNSGLYGNPQATGNIGGSLDLKLRKAGFGNAPLLLNASAGHEWNGHLQVYGADVAVSRQQFYTNFGAFYRHAGNYQTGHGYELPFSQFQKVNVFGNLGFKLANRHIVEGTVIYDCATNVGYPALNMDVSKAEGLIASLSYQHLFSHSFLTSWSTKAYYNHITHTMDDTKRPDVEIHMDMPGRSSTAGLYSLLSGANDRHDLQVNYDLYYNRLFADMTMYPGGAAPMYMVTWPDVGTLNTGLALNDNITIAHRQTITLSAKTAWQQQRLNNEEGWRALAVFFPGMDNRYVQLTGRVAAAWLWKPARWQLSAGAGWGSRAPTVTEAYGYYLNNTFDQYDYIGNPHLKNESAWELCATAGWMPTQSIALSVDANVFLFSNYIIGQFENRLSPMTVDAEGVKVYGNISHATILNAAFHAKWHFLKWLQWNTDVAYGLGRDADGEPLPLIAPLGVTSRLEFAYRQLLVQVTVKGDARQTHYGSKYGETLTPGYCVVSFSAQYTAPIQKCVLTCRCGVENLFDRYYTTYSDWNGIPQKGRNVFLNVQLTI